MSLNLYVCQFLKGEYLLMSSFSANLSLFRLCRLV